MDKKQTDDLIAEMRDVKKLLVLQLLCSDVSQRQIASMLEISEATMSRMIPRGTVKKGPKSSKRLPISEGS
ncbi:MAG: hypothetical protein IPL47_12575 [Phyllobacteriaceae bacterium]|nr:hypothetical protein [Phyllobacteriaceae bacterium]